MDPLKEGHDDQHRLGSILQYTEAIVTGTTPLASTQNRLIGRLMTMESKVVTGRVPSKPAATRFNHRSAGCHTEPAILLSISISGGTFHGVPAIR
jgi:hypothetical protein